MRISCFYLLLTVFFITAVIPLSAQPAYENFQLVWGDEFDADGLPNSANWGYEKGCSVRNNEAQYYAEAREKNSHIEDGTLIIEAHRESMNGCSYTSANLITKKRDFKYGLFEIRAQIDIRQGSWPAWWWLPASGGWPRGGEIDMMEFYRGNLLFNVMDGNQKWTSKTRAVSSIGGSDWAKEFHTWTWEWDSLKIDLYLDGKLMNHYNVANADGTGPGGENPFRRPGYMLINQAIGGNNGGDPSSTTFPVRYLVDYIRVYKPGKDTSAPKVTAVSATTAGIITVVFNEAVNKTSAEKLGNYSTATAGVSLSAAKLQGDERTVVLAATGLAINAHIELTVKGIADKAAEPNTLASVSRETTVVPESKKLTGTVIGNGSPYNSSKSVTYDMAVDGSTATFADCTGDPVWVGYDFGEGASFVITGFRFYPRDGYSDRMSGKTFEISDNGTGWEKLYTIPGAPPEGSFSTVSITPSRPVRYVRYNGSGGYLNVCEVEFRGYSGELTAVFPCNRRKVPYAGGAPYTVSLHTLDGRLIDRWTAGAGEPAGDITGILRRRHPRTAARNRLYLVTTEGARIRRSVVTVLYDR